MIRKGLPLLALVMIGGCGGSNSDSAVSATDAQPPATTTTTTTTQQTPADTTGQAPATPPAATPAATPDPSNPPAPAPVATATVPGAVVFAAVTRGIADNPADRSPYSSGCRQVVSAPAPAQTAFYLCGAMRSYQVTAGFPGPSGIGVSAAVSIEPIVNGDTIFGVTANGLRLDGPAVDLSRIDPQVDATAGAWKADGSSANLIVMSVAGKPAQMRVCWNVVLPPPAPITGPPGFAPIVRLEPFKRLMCGVYNRLAIGADVGGYVVDDIGGKVSVSEGSW